jgi:ATP-dependent DNA helicase RecQ
MLRDEALNLLRRATNNPQAQFRDGQWEAIEALVSDRARMLVVERTGWGKSLVYFIATRLLRGQGAGPTLLISPLLALMRNQIAAAERMGVRAETINSSNFDEWDAVTERVGRDEVDILLVSPERLGNENFRERVLLRVTDRVGLFVVDEAHCISDWGHDFRPDYRRITRIIQALPRNLPVLATTATANDRVVNDVGTQLGPNLRVRRGPLSRASLRLQNISLPSAAARMAWLAENLPGLRGSGIIYALTVRDADTVAEWLRSRGIDARAYHGEVAPPARIELEQALLANQVKALVATSALGMGFDKPDLGFVIHFQRPGSVIYYYQQVGRAGRAMEQAFGVLLSGVEDDDINDFFIENAFPREEHILAILDALEQSDDGLSTLELERQVNIPHKEIEKILKILVTEPQAPAIKRGPTWQATAAMWEPDRARIEAISRQRRLEKERMAEYQTSTDCLMEFLARELNDPWVTPCGRCASCVGGPILPDQVSEEMTREATLFLRRRGIPIPPRKQWIGDAMAAHGWTKRNIPADLQASPGFAIARWRDEGWGQLVARGKYEDGRFADELVFRAAEAIRAEWRPDPFPAWVTCVPSARHPELVPEFAARLAASLGLPFVPAVRKTRDTQQQKEMQNSYQQLRNLAGAFEIDTHAQIGGPVLLVDDTVDSRWTFTVVAALLRQEGSGPVFPFALAYTSSGSDE